jgi:hypothetical protein
MISNRSYKPHFALRSPLMPVGGPTGIGPANALRPRVLCGRRASSFADVKSLVARIARRGAPGVGLNGRAGRAPTGRKRDRLFARVGLMLSAPDE